MKETIHFPSKRLYLQICFETKWNFLMPLNLKIPKIFVHQYPIETNTFRRSTNNSFVLLAATFLNSIYSNPILPMCSPTNKKAFITSALLFGESNAFQEH